LGTDTGPDQRGDGAYYQFHYQSPNQLNLEKQITFGNMSNDPLNYARNFQIRGQKLPTFAPLFQEPGIFGNVPPVNSTSQANGITTDCLPQTIMQAGVVRNFAHSPDFLLPNDLLSTPNAQLRSTGTLKTIPQIRQIVP